MGKSVYEPVNEIRYKEVVQQIVTISNYSTLNGLSDYLKMK